MRIISGALKGRSLVPPKQFTARPTTDYAKEGLFNMLEHAVDFETTRLLDLFAGSGSISLEFISRGGAHATCIEMHPLHARFIREAARAFGVASRVQVVHHNVFDFLPLCTATYNMIFADPPYDLAGLEALPQKVFDSGILEAGGLFVLEHPSAFSFVDHPNFKKEKKYGYVHFSFFAN